MFILLAWQVVAAEPTYFASPDAAVKALIEALKSDRPELLESVMGPDVEQLDSGDPVADAAGRARFIAEAERGTKVELTGDGEAALLLGPEDWPFAIPLVKDLGDKTEELASSLTEYNPDRSWTPVVYD